MPVKNIPVWAQELKERFCSGTVSQFIIHGNIFDVINYPAAELSNRFMPLKPFLENVMMQNYDAIIYYDRGNGIRVSKGGKEWSDWTASIDYNNAALFNTREPAKALELIDHYILRILNLQAIKREENRNFSYKLAVILDFAQFIVPAGDPAQFANELGSYIVKILSWANDPVILRYNIVTFLITEKLNDLNKMIVENSHAERVEIKLPAEQEMLDYLTWLRETSLPELEKSSDLSMEMLAKRLTGLSRVEAGNIIKFAIKNGQQIKEEFLKEIKKEMIEKECHDLLEFYESPYNLDLVAGLDAAKQWLRQDAQLIRAGKIHALPMGYLISGRIGTGKTFLVQCWAGELGIPCVVFKNFRDKWVGTTESNLEKILSVLKALGEVIVFVDEADQMTGKRESGAEDGGLSGRVYAMLAKEMSNTSNRGKIIWVFATSRPDLLEVDLKRQGRLDVHIPLFPPQSAKEYQDLFLVVAKKLKIQLKAEDLPDLSQGQIFGGNEIEGMLVRALRIYELEQEPKRSIKEILQKVVREIKPNANTRKLEYMDLIAVRECTDAGFLPPSFAQMLPEEIENKIETLKRFM